MKIKHFFSSGIILGSNLLLLELGLMQNYALAQNVPPPPPPPSLPNDDGGMEGGPQEFIPPPIEEMPNSGSSFSSPGFGSGSVSSNTSSSSSSTSTSPAVSKLNTVKVNAKGIPSKKIPAAEEKVSINFPEPTEIGSIIRAVAEWTGKNFIISPTVRTSKISIIAPQELTKEEAYQAFLSALNTAGLTVIDSGKVRKIVSVQGATQTAPLKQFYSSTYAIPTDELITQIIKLKHVQAANIAPMLKNNLRIVQNVSPFIETNSLIVSDTGNRIAKLLEIIKLIDVEDNNATLFIEPCVNTDASDMASKVSEIFKGVPTLQKTIIDKRSNSLILIGSKLGLDSVVQVIRKLDKPLLDQSNQAQIHVRPLDYAKSDDLAQTLNNLAQGLAKANQSRPQFSTGMPNQAAKSTTAVVANFGDVKITSDKTTNSLIIQGSKAAYRELDSIIKSLDKRKDQVFLEVDIIDINIGDNISFGASVFAGAQKKNNGNEFSFPFGWNIAGGMGSILSMQAQAADPKLAAGAASAITSRQDLMLGVLYNKGISIGGVTLSPGALIFALKSDASSNVLQTPSILVANNEQASFESSEKTYFNTSTKDATGATSYKPEAYSVDLTLKITPQISKADFVNMDINLKAEVPTRSTREDLPMGKNSRSSQTKITVQNQQTVVISGLIHDKEDKVVSKVPLLGDIPILGWLFKSSNTEKRKSSLSVFVTPYIIRNSEDLAKIYEKKMKERDDFLKAFYGEEYKESNLYKKYPSSERGQVPTSSVQSAEPEDDSENESNKNDATNKPLPSQQERINVPSASNMSGSGSLINAPAPSIEAPVPSAGQQQVAPPPPSFPPPSVPEPTMEQPNE